MFPRWIHPVAPPFCYRSRRKKIWFQHIIVALLQPRHIFIRALVISAYPPDCFAAQGDRPNTQPRESAVPSCYDRRIFRIGQFFRYVFHLTTRCHCTSKHKIPLRKRDDSNNWSTHILSTRSPCAASGTVDDRKCDIDPQASYSNAIPALQCIDNCDDPASSPHNSNLLLRLFSFRPLYTCFCIEMYETDIYLQDNTFGSSTVSRPTLATSNIHLNLHRIELPFANE